MRRPGWNTATTNLIWNAMSVFKPTARFVWAVLEVLPMKHELYIWVMGGDLRQAKLAQLLAEEGRPPGQIR